MNQRPNGQRHSGRSGNSFSTSHTAEITEHPKTTNQNVSYRARIITPNDLSTHERMLDGTERLARETMLHRLNHLAHEAGHKLSNLGHSISDSVMHARDSVMHKGHDLSSTISHIDFDDWTNHTRSYLRKDPKRTLLIALGIGVVLGLVGPVSRRVSRG